MHQPIDPSPINPAAPDPPPKAKRTRKRNGNGNGTGNGDKPKRQFTEKQRRSFGVLELADSVNKGIAECVRLGIVCRSHFFEVWWKQPAYRAEVERRRDAIHDSMIVHARQVMRLAVEDAALKHVELIHDAENENVQLRASENVLVANGIELGKGTRVNVQNNYTVETSQAEFNHRLSKHISDRFCLPIGDVDG